MRDLIVEAEFDGHSFITREPIDLPAGQRVRLIVQPVIQVQSGADLVEYWRRAQVIGIWADRKADRPHLARHLRRRAEKRAP
ncbi:MAG: hypothetical protein HPY54_09360 [Chthonomonadetes bacterium]|nr:hypothetical protein [Chthonomonadetes bacterium]